MKLKIDRKMIFALVLLVTMLAVSCDPLTVWVPFGEKPALEGVENPDKAVSREIGSIAPGYEDLADKEAPAPFDDAFMESLWNTLLYGISETELRENRLDLDGLTGISLPSIGSEGVARFNTFLEKKKGTQSYAEHTVKTATAVLENDVLVIEMVQQGLKNEILQETGIMTVKAHKNGLIEFVRDINTNDIDFHLSLRSYQAEDGRLFASYEYTDRREGSDAPYFREFFPEGEQVEADTPRAVEWSNDEYEEKATAFYDITDSKEESLYSKSIVTTKEQNSVTEFITVRKGLWNGIPYEKTVNTDIDRDVMVEYDVRLSPKQGQIVLPQSFRDLIPLEEMKANGISGTISNPVPHYIKLNEDDIEFHTTLEEGKTSKEIMELFLDRGFTSFKETGNGIYEAEDQNGILWTRISWSKSVLFNTQYVNITMRVPLTWSKDLI